MKSILVCILGGDLPLLKATKRIASDIGHVIINIIIKTKVTVGKPDKVEIKIIDATANIADIIPKYRMGLLNLFTLIFIPNHCNNR